MKKIIFLLMMIIVLLSSCKTNGCVGIGGNHPPINKNHHVNSVSGRYK